MIDVLSLGSVLTAMRRASEWWATLHRGDDNAGRPLISLTEELTTILSAVATRSGFLRAAEWLVETGNWATIIAPALGVDYRNR
jgi:hypothetical protein